MFRRIKFISLSIVLFLANIITNYAVPITTYASTPVSAYSSTTKISYSKTLEQIYKSGNVYKDTLTRLSEYSKKYDKIAYLFSAGKSVQNRDLSVLKIGNGTRKIFINASHHPREYIGTALTLRQIQYLLEAYTLNQTIDGCNIRNLLNNQVSFYFMPLVNPDGVQICISGRSNYYFNANKVDLNHNYDANWYKEITKTYSTGNAPFSEPETAAIKSLCDSVDFDLAISYHAAGDVIYWYYGQKGAVEKRDLEYAKIIGKTTGYSVQKVSMAATSSGFKDWAVMKLKIPAFTIEIGGKRGISKPVEWSMFNSIWEKNKLVPIRVTKQLLSKGKTPSK